ncbi:MAG: triose-phosphate isomerase [Candidatus Pacebacteria bacterium]|nr:triose-phosphate isomerase [Candidatus Paceibacterota bacterium]
MKNLIVANWKMNPDSAEDAEYLFDGILKSAPKLKNTEIIICPPFAYLDRLSQKSKIKNGKVKTYLGAQDVFWENKGAFTGEISPKMLKKIGANYVIIGHSERRKNFVETDEMINKKIKAALKSGLKVIFCVGEFERDEKGEYLKFVKNEVLEGLKGIPRALTKNLTLAYEPVWAISSNKGARPDTPEELLQMIIYIRRILFFRFGRKIYKDTPVLYGGSVDENNAKNFIEKGQAQGLLVGRASLSAKSFVELLKSIN